MSVTNGIEYVANYLLETRDIAEAVKSDSRVIVPLADGRIPDKVIGRVNLFYFKKRGWIPKSVPIKDVTKAKDAQEGFLHWMGLRCYQVVGGVFRFLIWQGVEQVKQAAEDISFLDRYKRLYLNPLILKNNRDQRYQTASKIFLLRRDLFQKLEREGIYKMATGIAIVATAVFLTIGVLTYQPIFFKASILMGFAAVIGMSYLSFKKEEDLLKVAEEILGLKVEFRETETTSRSNSLSDQGSLPPPYPGEAIKPVPPVDFHGAVFDGRTPPSSGGGSSFEVINEKE